MTTQAGPLPEGNSVQEQPHGSVRSMTGFGTGAAEATAAAVKIGCEISSVNHRYLKVSCHVPDGLNWAQRSVESAVRSRFVRGALNVVLNLEGASTVELDVDTELLKRLYSKIEAARAAIAPNEKFEFRDLLTLEGVVQVAEARIQPPAVQDAIEQAVSAAVESLRSMQSREGAHLALELRTILESLDLRLRDVATLLPTVGQENRARYQQRVADLLEGTGVELNPADLAREVAILAEKADITEELGRLRGHIEQFSEVLDAGDRIGRKLDFLTQEMFREANTMASKANHREVVQQVVEVKADIDRLREQVQNIE